MTKNKNYVSDAISDAREMALNFLDEIVEQFKNKGSASDDINNDYPGGDEYHHLGHVDKEYHLSEAAELLDSLSRFTEDDYGLWQGLAPRDAISCQAAYTYGNAVVFYWSRLIDEINDDGILADALEDNDEKEVSDEVVRQIVKQLIKDFAG